MKLYASKNTCKAVSALAIVETIAASTIVLWLAAQWETLVPFATSVLVAPFLLMRTRLSTAYGVRLARRFIRWADTHGESPFLAGFGTAFLPLAIRIWATMVFVVREPFACLAAVPGNWWRLVAHSDVTRFPETVPGYRWEHKPGKKFEGAFWDLNGLLKKIKAERLTWPHKLFTYCLFIPLHFGHAWVYRWTLKSTWWVYLPLLWIIQPARLRRDSVWDRLQWIRDDRLVFWYSVLILAVGIVKIRIWQTQISFAEWWKDSLIGQFLNVYIAPHSMPAWQYAAIVNSIVAIVMYVVAGSAIRSRGTAEAWPDTYVDYGFRWATICRRLLTCYSVIVLVMITLQQGFPPLGKFLPL